MIYSKNNSRKNICFKAIQNSGKSIRLLQVWTEVCHQIFWWQTSANHVEFTEECVVYTKKNILNKKNIYKWVKHGFGTMGRRQFNKLILRKTDSPENWFSGRLILLKTDSPENWFSWKLILRKTDSPKNWFSWKLILLKTDSPENWFSGKLILQKTDSPENWFSEKLILLKTDSPENWFSWKLILRKKNPEAAIGKESHTNSKKVLP